MTVSEAIQARRATKHFDSEHVMSDEEFETLISHATLSPTAFNIQHWRFVRVNDRSLRQQIAGAAWDQPQVTDASLLLVLTMDVQAWQKEPERYWQDAPQEARDFILPALEAYYLDKPQVQRDEAMRSGGLVAMNMMLMAQQMGYDSCPMDGFDFDKVAELIKLPEDHLICMMLAIGKQSKDSWPRLSRLPQSEIVIENHY
ncbi:MAG: nitroreductase family protein [Gammaproteobacteria bacterium]|nr:nitroreductase family protein [Gammaproteobacteria bacterium]